MNGEALGAFKTPFGAFEPNVPLAGLEGAVAAWFGVALVADLPLIPPPFRYAEWHWSIVVWGLLVLASMVLVGLAVEGLAGAAERFMTWKGFNSYKLRSRFAKLFGEPDAAAWRDAQRWIWSSPQASDEFARRRLRLLAARNTAFVFLATTLSVTIGLLLRRPDAWLGKIGFVLFSGIPGTVIFTWVWIAAQQGYNRAVEDAGRLGPP